jgi:hypothetical protein
LSPVIQNSFRRKEEGGREEGGREEGRKDDYEVYIHHHM